ncbi:hypothetical protein U9M48_031689 [Paspalum notatum var. saurae]|uniref:Reverse transcriptase RNase H-like domain-containing protein n=1 Tax=Paspalum notatum var. saurae TaxID=547442 RepID=A0AAQ3U3H6_PASNO
MDLLDFTVALLAFHWGRPQEDAFNLLKHKLTHAPLLQLPDFGKTFELECIGGVLMQENKPVAYFSEKLSGSVLNYSTIVCSRSLETWQHYLWPKELVIHSDHESLKHIRSQVNLNCRHAKWVEFIESFPYVIKHKKGKDNLDHRIFGIESIKKQYAYDEDFKDIMLHCKEGRTWDKYVINEGYVFRANRLCIPVGSAHLLLLQEAHGGGLMGHFGAKKMEAKNLKMWEECLPHVEFAYNRAVHSTTKVVYGFNPRAPIDLLPLPTSERVHHDAKERADFILKLHKTTKDNIEKMNERYRKAGNKGRKKINLEPGDLVWLHLRKDRFPDLRKFKLIPRADGPFKIIEKINDNAYKLELPPEFGVSPTFNIADLKPYLGEEDELESRTTPLQEGKDDEDISLMLTSDTPSVVMHGSLTRARARQLNQ